MVRDFRFGESRYSNICGHLGPLNSHTRFVWIAFTEGHLSDVIVFIVGLVVSTLVVFGIFSRVVLEMHDAKNHGVPGVEYEEKPSAS